ncbi:putative kinetochore protein mis14 protein [Neofusicoccum parvum UCRNP2]|uniref:Putative kinetochore protein mis14 protein n=1 Tax=Botryosphaeria parva (strain UCR-NP2) TaxID=1287680 RepID=R1EML7_BOTPV|nr:putative kinetochore protein mis14 protein [Neofusicoccum parvum UCRNP2]
MDSTHRRVELQSAADMTYLIASAKRAARAKIDLHLPPSAAPEGGEDVLRRRVEELVDEYIRNVFAGARHGISVNGIEAAAAGEVEEEVTEDFEPIDSRLVDKIRQFEAQKETLTEKVADLRRDAPKKAAAAYETSFMQESEEMERRARDREEAAVRSAGEETKLDTGEMRRWDDVQQMWEKGTQNLVELKDGLTETAARLDRAAKVADHLHEGKS